jgi:predicted methyltransferase
MKFITPIAACLFAAACYLAPAAAQADEGLKAALAAPHRTPANVLRDGFRNPYPTLTFFGIKPHMTVVELAPGGGWYTEILAPYLRDKGQLVLAADDPNSANEYRQRSGKRMRAKLDALPAVYDKVNMQVFEVPAKLSYAQPGSADLVLTFRNVHNWVGAGGDAAVQAVFKSAFDALKKGGVMGVVEHRLPAGRTQEPKADSGYVHEAYVVKMAEAVGFKLDAKSEINANPKDTADHEKGVWALPPTLANRDKDRAKYEAIGESDRMTLRFVKP